VNRRQKEREGVLMRAREELRKEAGEYEEKVREMRRRRRREEEEEEEE